MSFFGNGQPPRASFRAPSSQSSSSRSESYDYSGWDDYQKKTQELQPLAEQKYGQLYAGDVPGSVTTGQRIRHLQDLLANYPTPFVRVSSTSTSGSSSYDGPQYSYDDEMPQPQPSPPADDEAGEVQQQVEDNDRAHRQRQKDAAGQNKR